MTLPINGFERYRDDSRLIYVSPPKDPTLRISNSSADAMLSEIALLRQLCDDLADALRIHMPKHHMDMALFAYDDMKANRK